MTELDGDDGIRYVMRAGSERGREFAESLGLTPAELDDVADADRARRSVHTTERSMPADAAAIVLADLEHPRWDDVAERCLTCGNCTAVCPTCFCTGLDDRVELDGRTAHRDRVWDTCFSLEYSHLGPGPARSSARSRYRQWLTHKLGTWHDQFGESGCVGCGRCITWCPVGIDLTAEVEALAAPEATP
jgi:sulfhydrogenase subunit beta (sulfur reductase)